MNERCVDVHLRLAGIDLGIVGVIETRSEEPQLDSGLTGLFRHFRCTRCGETWIGSPAYNYLTESTWWNESSRAEAMFHFTHCPARG